MPERHGFNLLTAIHMIFRKERKPMTGPDDRSVEAVDHKGKEEKKWPKIAVYYLTQKESA